MKVLVIGFGSVGQRHAENALALGHDVIAYDTVANKQPNGWDIDYVGSEFDAWKWEPTAVIIASPTSTHAPYLYRAIANGIRLVLVEKPIALSVGELSALACLGGVRVSVGYNLRFHDGLRAFKQRLYGKTPVTASFVCRCNKAAWPGASYADMLLEGSHEIDAALWSLGPATVIGASGYGDRWTILLKHASGCVTTVVLDGAYSGQPERTIEVSTEQDTFRHETTTGTRWRWKITASDTEAEAGTVYAFSMYRQELADFLSERNGCASFDDGLAVLNICDRARIAAARS